MDLRVAMPESNSLGTETGQTSEQTLQATHALTSTRRARRRTLTL